MDEKHCVSQHDVCGATNQCSNNLIVMSHSSDFIRNDELQMSLLSEKMQPKSLLSSTSTSQQDFFLN